MEREGRVERIDLLGYWPVLVRRRWAIYLSVIAFAAVALIGSFLMTPLYRATATLQIERQNPDILNVRDVSRTDYAWAAYADFYQTQYRILSSTPVAREAAERMNLTTREGFLAAPGGLGALKSRVLSLIPRKRGPEIETDPIDVATKRVRAGLEIAPVRNSQLVKVSWVDADRELAAEIANGVAEAYIQRSLTSKYDTTDQARVFLDEQIAALKGEIADLESQLQDYGESKRIVSIDESSNLTLKALQRISEEQTNARTELARAKAARRAARESHPDALPEVLESNLIGRLRADYATLEADYSEKSKRFKEDWPELERLRSKLEQSRERLELETQRIARQVLAAAEAHYVEASTHVDELERLVTTHEASAQQLKRDAGDYAYRQSAVGAKRDTLDALMQRRNEMSLSASLRNMKGTSSNVHIIERAVAPAGPFRPNTRLNLLAALLLGLGFGVALTFLLEHLDNTISSSGELDELLSIPLLAVIPRHGRASPARTSRRHPALAEAQSVDLIAHRDGKSAVAEAYRALRTSILLSNPGEPPRRILLTSAAPEEGKTATALNLAIVLAQLGSRVLLVDTDLRRPRLHRATGAENRTGVSTYLSGLEHDPTRLVQPSGIDNLDLMTSGPIPPNPSELLNSTVFTRMGDELLASGYDHIVFDSPPVLSVSDAVIIAAVADSGILVVRAGRTPRPSIRLAAERLGQAQRNFGVVLNDLDTDAPGYPRYDYYGHHDGDTADDAPTAVRNAGGGA